MAAAFFGVEDAATFGTVVFFVVDVFFLLFAGSFVAVVFFGAEEATFLLAAVFFAVVAFVPFTGFFG